MPNLETKEAWVSYARANEDILTSFILNWHPASNNFGFSLSDDLEITASAPENACGVVRAKIAQEEASKSAPKDRFKKALLESDVDEIYSLLNSAWFGVPESTSCWGVTGFKQAVELLEQPPMSGEGEENE